MSFNQKATTFSVSLIVLLFIAVGFWHYKKTHPIYVAPLPSRPEVSLTIIPGWNLRQVAGYLVEKGFASSTDDVYKITGEPGVAYTINNPVKNIMDASEIWASKPVTVSYEGYIAPETYWVFADSSLKEVLQKFLNQREKQIDPDIVAAIKDKGLTIHEALTMASIIEKEVKFTEDQTTVADILWRRLKAGWPLQVDSSVHYAVDKTGDVFTTDKERDTDSAWNTYKYPGLPPGPIASPGLVAIRTALYTSKNDYWYFLSDKDGKMHFAKTLEEQSANKYKYLR
jgi:UPF0755 protein